MEVPEASVGTWRPGIIPLLNVPGVPMRSVEEIRAYPATESEMIIALGQRFALGEADMVATAAATARKLGIRISDVIEKAWHDYCE